MGARDQVLFREIDAVYATFKYDNTITYDVTQNGGSASVNLAVTMNGDDTVSLTTDASAVVGRLHSVHSDGYCTVQVDGFIRLPKGTSGTLTAGNKVVGSLSTAAKGYVRNVAAATLAEVAVARGLVVSVSATTTVNVAGTNVQAAEVWM